MLNKKDLKDLKTIIKHMEWCDLSDEIIEMEQEIQELKPIMTKKEIKDLEHVLEIFEQEKWYRVKEGSIYFYEQSNKYNNLPK